MVTISGGFPYFLTDYRYFGLVQCRQNKERKKLNIKLVDFQQFKRLIKLSQSIDRFRGDVLIIKITFIFSLSHQIKVQLGIILFSNKQWDILQD